MNRFEDELSTTNVSLIEEENSVRRINTSPLPISNTKKQPNDTANKEILKPGSMALKHQENTLDGLKKENFDLRLSLYFYEQRLSDMSPENIDKALKENVKLKVSVQELSQELKRYKNMILELTQAVEILEKKPCPIPHGMTSEEKEEFERMKNEVESFHDENDKLSRMMADLSAENVRLRSNLRSKNSSTTTTESTSSSSSECNNEDHHDIYRKYRQAKLKLEEQQRMLQQQTNSGRLYDRDKVPILNRQLEEERKRVDSLQLELDKYKQQLRNKNMECNQLIEENEDLRINNENMGTLIDNIRQMEEENTDLVNEIQDREQEIEALEAEVVKLLSHLEKKEGDTEKNSRELDNRIITLEATIQEREDEIEMLKSELKSINESHDHDIEVFEEHVNKTQEELEKKDQENKELLEELQKSLEKSDEIKREFEEILEKQYNELIVTIRDREVRMATLEGNFEAKTDTMQREKELLQEEMDELKDRLKSVYEQLKEKEDHVADLTHLLNSRSGSEKSYVSKSESRIQEKVSQLENRLKECQEKLKREQRKAEEQLANQNNAYRALKQKLITANQKNTLLNNLLDQTKKSSESVYDRSDKYSLLSKLNDELRRELEDRDRVLEKERKKREEYKDLYHREMQANTSLKKQLERRETMLANSLLARDALKEQGEFMENILYEQATGGHSFRDRSDSAMSSF